MFFIISGNNYPQKKKKIDSIKNTLLSKKPNADFLVFDNFDINEDLTLLDSLLETSGLFEEKNIIMFINILENKKIKDFFIENLEKFKNSENAFIFSEEKILKYDLNKIEKFSQISETYTNIVQKDNIFYIVDFIAKRDKKNLWIEYNKLLLNNNSEDIYNIFLWEIKTLLITSKIHQVQDSGLKPFVYNKNKNFLKYWKKNEIEKKYIELLDIQYKNRKYSQNTDILLERFILNL